MDKVTLLIYHKLLYAVMKLSDRIADVLILDTDQLTQDQKILLQPEKFSTIVNVRTHC